MKGDIRGYPSKELVDNTLLQKNKTSSLLQKKLPWKVD
jgi:hypothetical protein